MSSNRRTTRKLLGDAIIFGFTLILLLTLVIVIVCLSWYAALLILIETRRLVCVRDCAHIAISSAHDTQTTCPNLNVHLIVSKVAIV